MLCCLVKLAFAVAPLGLAPNLDAAVLLALKGALAEYGVSVTPAVDDVAAGKPVVGFSTGFDEGMVLLDSSFTVGTRLHLSTGH